MIELKQRISFIHKIHLFNGLKDEELAGIAEKLVEKIITPGQVVFESGSVPDGFYMIFSGQVKVTRPRQAGSDCS